MAIADPDARVSVDIDRLDVRRGERGLLEDLGPVAVLELEQEQTAVAEQ